MERLPRRALSALTLLICFWASTASAQGDPTTLRQGDQTHSAQIEGGQIALILDEEVLQERTDQAALLKELEAQTLPGMPANIVAVSAPELVDELDLKDFGRQFEEERGDLVTDTGVLLRLDEARAPSVMTGQIIVQLAKDVEPEKIEAVVAQFGVEVVMKNPFDDRQFVIEAGEERGTLQLSNDINALPETEYAHPNLYQPMRQRQAAVTPNDTYFPNQWHLDNDGQNGGTPDADIDADLAWSFTTGNPGIIIAVIDDAFEINHPDLAGNLWTNPGEIAGDGIDNDLNGLVDDVNGWDFTNCTSGTTCGDANPGPSLPGDDHGTLVAGAALAQQGNNLGVSGSCPNCTFLPIRATNGTVFAEAVAMQYAQAMGAHVITNSWGYTIGTPATQNVVNAINQAAANGRGGLGSVVLFAMNNINTNDCVGMTPDISSLASVIAVSRVTNLDQFNPGGFGACMDVLGPTNGGTLNGTTTDRVGTNGFNNASPPSIGCPVTDIAPPPNTDRDYTLCFNGTSFATPVVAGVVGLMLSLDNTLTRQEVQRVLQDTADKVEDSAGQYAEATGFSAPSVGAPTHGYGRINAFEAVRHVAARAVNGRGARDLVIRDNRLDWGNTEQPSNVLMETTRGFIAHYRSVDIKVDAPPFAATAPATSAAFDAFGHEDPLSGQANRVYVRVHNRGHRAVNDVTVKLHWAFAGAGLPALPSDFWTAFPSNSADTSIWTPMPAQTIASVGYSGASVGGTPAAGSQILSFTFDAPEFDETLPNPDHYCLFAVVTAGDDPVSAASMASLVPDLITPRDNNVTHRNVKLINSSRSERLVARMMMNNPFERQILTWLRANPPQGWKVASEGVNLFERLRLDPHESRLVEIEVFPNSDFARGEVDIQQVYLDEKTESISVLGGHVVELRPKRTPGFDTTLNINPNLLELLRRHQIQLELHQGLVSKMMGAGSSDTDMRMLNQVGSLLKDQGRLMLRAGER